VLCGSPAALLHDRVVGRVLPVAARDGRLVHHLLCPSPVPVLWHFPRPQHCRAARAQRGRCRRPWARDSSRRWFWRSEPRQQAPPPPTSWAWPFSRPPSAHEQLEWCSERAHGEYICLFTVYFGFALRPPPLRVSSLPCGSTVAVLEGRGHVILLGVCYGAVHQGNKLRPRPFSRPPSAHERHSTPTCGVGVDSVALNHAHQSRCPALAGPCLSRDPQDVEAAHVQVGTRGMRICLYIYLIMNTALDIPPNSFLLRCLLVFFFAVLLLLAQERVDERFQTGMARFV
jgi:hypothetical protein